MAFGRFAMEPLDTQRVLTIEWEMMDKRRFFPLSLLNSLVFRGILYPLTVIKTRLQVQKHNAIYRGMFDAFRKIVRYEGFFGLYKGFWINSIQIVSGIGYISTYEKVRHLLGTQTGVHDGRIKGLVGGICGSLVGQTIITPFDVVSQHMMVIGQKSGVGANHCSSHLNLPPDTTKGGLALCIVKELYRRDGLKGFYRGYFASLATYVPSSGLWWLFYPVYTDLVASLVPIWTPQMVIRGMAGPLGGLTVCIITNPLDVIRARIQVNRMNSIYEAASLLWAEERLRIFIKGLSARLVQSSISSFVIVIGYESLKRWSLYDQYKDQVKW